MEKQELLTTFIINLVRDGLLPEGINPGKMAEGYIEATELINRPDTGTCTSEQAQDLMFSCFKGIKMSDYPGDVENFDRERMKGI